MKNSVILLGCKHSGKTTQGSRLAFQSGRIFIDTDDLIQEICGLTPRELYVKEGVSGFMLTEEKAAGTAAVRADSAGGAVIATGGGICDNPPALNALRGHGIFVFLKVDVNFSVERIMRKVTEPEPGKFEGVPAFILAKNPSSMKDIRMFLKENFASRYALYQDISDITVELDNAPRAENFRRIVAALSGCI